MADGREPRLFSTRSLYHLCVSAVVDRFRVYKPYLVDLPKSVRFDLYYQVKRTSSCAVVGVTTTGSRGRGGVPSSSIGARSHPRAMIATLVFIVSRLVVDDVGNDIVRPLCVPNDDDTRSSALSRVSCRGPDIHGATNSTRSRCGPSNWPISFLDWLRLTPSCALNNNVWRTLGFYRSDLFQLYTERRLCILGAELSDLETFSKMLKVTNRRLQLLKIFQVSLSSTSSQEQLGPNSD